MPDIDVDFEDARRDEVINYVTGKYGQDHVAQIITFGTMLARAAVRDVGRVMGYGYSEVDRIAKAIPTAAGHHPRRAPSSSPRPSARCTRATRASTSSSTPRASWRASPATPPRTPPASSSAATR